MAAGRGAATSSVATMGLMSIFMMDRGGVWPEGVGFVELE